jgi:TolA-binding protein
VLLHPLGQPRNGFSKIGVLIGLAVTSIAIFAGLFAVLIMPSGMSVDQSLDLALQLVESDEPVLGSRLAERWSDEDLADDNQRAKQLLVLGVSAWKRSQIDAQSIEAHDLAVEASELLGESKVLGFPKGYEGFGNFCLGMAWNFLDRLDDCIAPLTIATERYPKGRDEAFAALMRAFSEKPKPELKRADETLATWQSLPPTSTEQTELVAIAKARLAATRNDLGTAVSLLEEVLSRPAHSTRAAMLHGELLLRQSEAPNVTGEAAAALQSQSLDEFRRIIADGRTTPEDRRTAQYWMADALGRMGRDKEALSLFASLRIGLPGASEALKCGVREIEILSQLDQPDEIATIARQINRAIPDPKLYASIDCDIAALRLKLLAAARRMLQKEQFEPLIQFGLNLPTVCSENDRARILAEAYSGWAGKRLDDEQRDIGRNRSAGIAGKSSAFGNGPDAGELSDEMLTPEGLYRLAARNYEELARLEIRSTEYPELLWQAIESYRLAHSLKDSNRLLKDYVEFEDRAKRPRAYVLLGENLLSVGQYDEAIVKLDQCLDSFPNHPISFRARLTSAKAHSEKLDFASASELLLQNLYDGSLEPQSDIWRESLLELGEVLFRQGDVLQLTARNFSGPLDPAKYNEIEEGVTHLLDAAQKMREASQRFGVDQTPIKTQYLTAQAFRLASRWPRAQLDSDQIVVDEQRQKLVQQERQLQQKSLDAFEDLRNRLNATPSALILDPTHRSLLRNAYFGEADLLFELGDYKSALLAYRGIANQFLNEPEALESQVQIARCYEKLNDPVRRDLTYTQAQQILDRIPAEKDPDFLKYTRFDRAKWGELLDWYSKEAAGKSTVQ